MEKKSIKRRTFIIIVATLGALLLASLAANIYFATSPGDSYLQSKEEIYIMESGILRNCLEFAEGQTVEFTYDMTHEDYSALLEEYDIAATADEGSEFQRALRLMDEYSSRLHHNGNYDNSIEMNALSLLEYSLDNNSHGINCRAKAQILNEMCLALGIYSRKVWIMPASPYDNECHVVNEVWDSQLEKWVMLDITGNFYWVDENGTPLSVLEIREKGAMQEFCTPVTPDDSLSNLPALKKKYDYNFIYIMKNMVYMEYLPECTVGEQGNFWLLFPENLNTNYELLIDESSILASPN